jgi:hypothetical protein
MPAIQTESDIAIAAGGVRCHLSIAVIIDLGSGGKPEQFDEGLASCASAERKILTGKQVARAARG